MTLHSTDYASLAQASYKDPVINQPVTIGGLEYKAVDFASDPRTGFQATAYEHVNTNGSHEVVIAYRGTEFDREPVHDGFVDAGMALARLNVQKPDADAFTQRVMEAAKKRAEDNGYPLAVSVTGHSLGGTTAEIEAYKFGLHGETFNAFGAAGLMQGIPQGGNQVIDHVRATDVVSAASVHFGEVRTYATQQDIDALGHAGYTNIPLLNALPTHAPILGKIQGEAHGIANFAPSLANHNQSIIRPEDEQRYQANKVEIDAYRNDIRHARTVVSLPGAVMTEISQVSIEAHERVSEAAQYAGHKTVLGADYVGHKAAQGAEFVADKAVQGVHYAADKTVQSAEYVGHKTVQGAEYVADKTVQGAHYVANKTVQGAEYVGHKTVQGAEYVADKTMLGAHQVAEKTMHGVHAVEQGAQHVAQGVSQGYTDLSDRIDRMLAASNKGDWASFNKESKVFAEMAPGRAQQAHAVAHVDLQEQHAAQLQAAQQVTQAAQQQPVVQSPGLHR